MTEAGPTQMIMIPKRQWFALAAYAACLAVGSLLPSGARTPLHWDAAVSPSVQDALHLPAYAILAILASAAWRRRWDANWCSAAIPALVCIGFGTMLELAQAAVPGRTCSLGDGLVNALGVTFGSFLMVGWRRFRPTPRTGAADGTPRKEQARC
jgi:VanZ family protein